MVKGQIIRQGSLLGRKKKHRYQERACFIPIKPLSTRPHPRTTTTSVRAYSSPYVTRYKPCLHQLRHSSRYNRYDTAVDIIDLHVFRTSGCHSIDLLNTADTSYIGHQPWYTAEINKNTRRNIYVDNSSKPGIRNNT